MAEIYHRQVPGLTTDETYYAPIDLDRPRETTTHRQVSTKTYYAPKRPATFPIAGSSRITQGPSEKHMGVDFAAALGTPVVAPAAGMISRIQRSKKGYGWAVFMIDLKTGLEHTFAHLGSIGVKIGEVLRPGEQLGTVGSSGASSGPHLHYEIGPAGADPFYGKASEAGAIDPTPFLESAGIGSMVGLIPGTVSDSLSGLISPIADPIYESGRNGSRPESGFLTPGSSAARWASQAEGKEPGAALSPFERIAESAGEGIKRAGFIAAGYVIILLGLILLAYSYREQIGGGVKGAAKVATVATAPATAPSVIAKVD